jgi:hypothetical protein
MNGTEVDHTVSPRHRSALSPARIAKVALVFMLVAFCAPRNAAGWTQQKFMLGTSDGPCIDSVLSDVTHIQTLGSLSIDLTSINPAIHYSLLFDSAYLLGVMHQGNMTTWVPTADPDSHHPGWWVNEPFDPTWAGSLVSTVQGLPSSSRDAQLGYLVADEPDPADADYVKGWISYVHQHDASKLAYFNIVGMGALEGTASYAATLDFWFNDSDPLKRPDVVAYDNYPFFSYEEDCGVPDGVSLTYFRNIALAKEKAGGRPVWLYLSTHSFAYLYKKIPNCGTGPADTAVTIIRPEPTPEQFRFATFCPLAYGVKGLLYWNYIARVDLMGDGIIHDCPDTTSPWKFGAVKSNDQYIANLVGPAIMNSAFVGAYHRSADPNPSCSECLTSPTGELVPAANIIGANSQVIASTTYQPALVGVFAEPGHTHYLMVVNKSYDLATHNVTLYLRGDYTNQVFLSPSPIGYSGSTSWTSASTTYIPAQNKTAFTISGMFGGEGRLVKLTKDLIAPSGSALGYDIDCTSIRFTWGAAGDDGTIGVATSYEIRSSTSPLTDANFVAGTLVSQGDLATLPDYEVTVSVGACSTPLYYAIRFLDDSGNVSPVGANTPLIGTPCESLSDQLSACNVITFTWANPSFVCPDGGAPATYEIRGSTATLTDANFSSGVLAASGSLGNPPSVVQANYNAGLCVTPRHYAIRFVDGASNVSPVSANTSLLGTPCTCDGGHIDPSIAAPRELALSTFANPTAGPLTIRFSIPAELDGSKVDMATFDAAGRIVRRLWSGPASIGDHVITWDLRDESGNLTRPGVYFVRLTTGSRTLKRTVTTVP